MDKYVLGRGLASLIPKKEDQDKSGEVEAKEIGQQKTSVPIKEKTIDDQPVKSKKIEKTDAAGQVLEVEVGSIKPNEHQPRKDFDPEKITELADSIREHGIIQPLVVTEIDGGYILIAGERRLLASKEAGLEKVPVVIKKASSEKRALMALVENIQRDDLNPIEEAMAFARLEEKFFLTQDEIAQKVGKSRTSVANTKRLLGLPLEIQRGLKEGKITEGHARAILSLQSPEHQRALYRKIISSNLSVRQAEFKVKKVKIRPHTRNVQIDNKMNEVITKIETSLGTKVSIKKSKRGGFIEIAFFSDSELDGLVNKLSGE